MAQQAKKQRLEFLERLCRERGVPRTVQRRAILATMLDLDNHPTADHVYEAVAKSMPGISRTTVYRTLETLVRMGVITKACHPGSVVRYDNRIDTHHHLVCQRCDDVVDISDARFARFDELPVPDTSASGFEVLDVRVQFHGICGRCREKEGS